MTIIDHLSPYAPAADLERHSQEAKFIIFNPPRRSEPSRPPTGPTEQILDDVGTGAASDVVNMTVERRDGQLTQPHE